MKSEEFRVKTDFEFHCKALSQTERSKSQLIYSQIIIGGIIILGSIASMVLAFKTTDSDNGTQINLFSHIKLS